MILGGYAGKLLFVDLTDGAINELPLSDSIASKFVGGYGIGARILYEIMKKGADPLGPQLKRAGYDAVFVSGVSRKPVYPFIKEGKAEIRDARNIWEKDCTETQEVLIEETGVQNLRAALIGPGGERQALTACIVNDRHRAAARGGSGAVMGSKNLKAVALVGSAKIPVADLQRIKKINREILEWMKNGPTKEMVRNWGDADSIVAMTQDMKLDKLVTNKFKLEDINDVAEKMDKRQVRGRWICAFD
jgi:aldehyde:ferredoxin oxidoreductase